MDELGRRQKEREKREANSFGRQYYLEPRAGKREYTTGFSPEWRERRE